MGSLCSGGTSEDKNRNDVIQAELSGSSKAEFENTIRVLLLGAGESGKSTVFKQLRIILQDGFSHDECIRYKDAVYANTLSGMKSLVLACQRYGYDFESPENEERAKKIAQITDSVLLTAGKVWTSELGSYIKSLWGDPSVKKAYEKRSEFQIGDSAEYYFESIDRINQTDYVPTTQDVVRTRVKTTGIVETNFKVGQKTITLVDVGGQRNERKKWIHCFEGVDAVLYVISLSEFDQKCYEDDKTNRMMESLSVFEDTLNAKWFQTTRLILFFNKLDIFKKKIQHADLKQVFEEYDGGNDPDKASQYIVDQFKARNVSNERPIYHFFTCATETDQLKQVWDDTAEILMKNTPAT